ncbi:ELM1/GtrOC1 family putative glycosyltransferase [Aestuariivirga sp.]|uniref:ELM1/GtrOC1 family putative glycosyltransferase n=1 Tax=Aestuariivirga sp. TaxID=2650926 RepID=UPI003BAC45B1
MNAHTLIHCKATDTLEMLPLDPIAIGSSPGQPDAGRQALIWVLGGSKLGDNSQLLRAVEAMNLPFQYKDIVLRPNALSLHLPVRATLSHIDLELSSALVAPWPDLVVTIGRHLSCVALWLKKQSGGRTKIALFNAPRARKGDFDLVLVPAHYVMSEDSRVLRYRFPLTALNHKAVVQAPPRPSPHEPIHVLLIGGPTKELILDTAVATDILKTMRTTHAKTGHIAIVTSRRTPADLIEELQAQLLPGETLYRWKANDAKNPYRPLLAVGQTFTVTGDSPSMLTDIASLGKRLVIAPLPASRSIALRMEQRLEEISRKLSTKIPNWSLPAPAKRNYNILHQLLIEQGYAVMLGDEPKAPTLPFPDESQLVAEGLKSLLR